MMTSLLEKTGGYSRKSTGGSNSTPDSVKKPLRPRASRAGPAMEPRARAGKNRGQQNFSDQELQMLLYAHGDVPNSLDSTKKVLDEMLSDFIVELSFEADRAAQLAGRQKVKVDDFKFACRKDPVKLGKIQEVFDKKAEIDAIRKAVDTSDDKITKGTVLAAEEELGEADDDQETLAAGSIVRGKGKK